MDEKEKNILINKILNASKDLKSARVAASIFINKSTDDEAKFFIDYLDSEDNHVRKLVRYIIGQKGIIDALPQLMALLNKEIQNLTFIPEEEYKESAFYPNIIDILESIFSIVKENNIKDDELLNKLFEIFKRTKNEDLRFTLIKLICYLGDKIDYFLKYFDDLGEKEKRALYYVYSFKEDPNRLKIFEKGLNDDKNFEYVIANLLKFEQGRIFLNEKLVQMNNFKINIVLKAMLDGSYPELEPALLKLLNNESKYIINLAIENLKKTIDENFPIEQFIFFLENNYSTDMIKSSLEIVEEFKPDEAIDIFLNALEKQPLVQNKAVIIDYLTELIKREGIKDIELSKRILNDLIHNFDTYSSKHDDLYVSILKLIVLLKFESSNEAKWLKSKLIKFLKTYENGMTKSVKNNISEFFVKLNQIISRFEEAESKIKDLLVLFNIDVNKIDYERIVKLKKQLEEIEYLDDENRNNLEQFLYKVYKESNEDWKKREIVVELLSIYGDKETLKFLKQVYEKESSLGVKLAAQNAIKNLYRNLKVVNNILIIENLFYINKLIKDYFESELYKVFNLSNADELNNLKNKEFDFVFISENIFDNLNDEKKDILEKISKKIVIIASKIERYNNLDMNKYSTLKKPFNREVLESLYGTE